MLWLILAHMCAHANECDANREILLVGVENSAPYSFKDTKWTGLSVELWEKVALDNQFNFQYIEVPFDQMLNALSRCEIDLFLPGVTISAERELIVDFSHSYLVEDVAIATNLEKDYFDLTRHLFFNLINPIGFLMVTLVLVGSIYFIFEKRNRSLHCFFDSIYWAMTTLSTVGYGDEAPKSKFGKIVAMIWMFAAIFVFAGVSASVLDAFKNANLPLIENLEDLGKYKVLTVADTYSDFLLSSRQIPHMTVVSEKEMYQKFHNGDVEFLVYDRSILEYHLKTGIIYEKSFYEQNLGFAMNSSFRHKEALNRSILSNIASEWWKSTIFSYKKGANHE